MVIVFHQSEFQLHPRPTGLVMRLRARLAPQRAARNASRTAQAPARKKAMEHVADLYSGLI